MKSQPANESKPQPRLSQIAVYARQLLRMKTVTWFNKPSFFKLKSGFLSRFSSDSHASLADDTSLALSTQTSSRISTKVSAHSAPASVSSDQRDVTIKTSSKLQHTLDSVSSEFEAPIARTSTTHSNRPIRSTPPQKTPDYRQPISNVLVTIPIIPGYCF